MSDMPAPLSTPTDEHKEKYYSFQVRGWTNFDPMDKTLSTIAESIEQGDGFLTLIDVHKTESDLANISDEEVRECFANILAAKRLLKTVHELPKTLVEELRSALQEAGSKKVGGSVASFPASEEVAARAKRWP
jgi:hypothetical protein